MLKIISRSILITSVFTLMLCSGGSEKSISSASLQNQSVALSFVLPCSNGSAQSDTLSNAVAILSGSDIETITANLTLEKCKITGSIINIPAGENRKIVVNVYNTKNKLVYTGTSSFFSIYPGKTSDIVLRLQSQTGGVNITGIICDENPDPGVEFIPDTNTIALYHFNEDTGNVIHDAMEKWHGFLFGGKRVAGYSGNAVKFEYGDSAMFDTIIPNHAASGTIELCFKFDESPKKDSVYLLFGNEGSRCNIYFKNDTLVFMKNHSDIFKSVAFSAILYSDKWYHVAGTWGSKGMRLFLNDNLVASNSDVSYYESSPRATAENLYRIGNKSYCCMNGGDMEMYRPVSVEAIIDEVRISKIERY